MPDTNASQGCRGAASPWTHLQLRNGEMDLEVAGETGELKPPGPDLQRDPTSTTTTSTDEIHGDETGPARFPNSTTTTAGAILMIQIKIEIARLCRTNKKDKVFLLCFSFVLTPLLMSLLMALMCLGVTGFGKTDLSKNPQH